MPDQTLKQRLKELARRGNREKPYAFVGRADELEFLKDNAIELPPEGGEGRTALIMGAPGAGKSALMNEAITRLCAKGQPKTAVIPVSAMGGDPLAERLKFFRKLAQALIGHADPAKPEQTVAQHSEVSGGLAGVAGGKAGQSITESSLSNVTSFEEIGDLAPKNRKGKPKFKPFKRVVLAVDEIQNIKPDSWVADVLNAAHIQKAVPVTVMCAGLADSLLALNDAGLPRLSEGRALRLGKLSQREAQQAVRQAITPLRDLGLEIDDALLIGAARVAKASDGWPAHLHVYLTEAFRQLAAMPEPSAARLDWDAVLTNGTARRETYYAERLAATQTPPAILHAAVSAINQNQLVSKYTAMQAIADAVESLRQNGNTLAADMWDETFDGSATKCYRQMLHAGIITEDPFECCEVPIPTLATFIALNANPQDGSIGNREANLPNR